MKRQECKLGPIAQLVERVHGMDEVRGSNPRRSTKISIMNQIQAIIFDIDGVLLDSFEANLKFNQDLMSKVGYRPPTREKYAKLFHLPLMDTIRILTKIKDEDEIKRIWEIGKNREVAYDISLLTLPEKTEDVVTNLSKDYRLGIVTSRVKNGVYESPELAKLKKYFKVAVSFEDTENHKPHPEPLLLAARKLKVEPEKCVYVGDTETDIIAAKAAGMRIITYAKERLAQSDIHAYNFRELPDLIKSLDKN